MKRLLIGLFVSGLLMIPVLLQDSLAAEESKADQSKQEAPPEQGKAVEQPAVPKEPLPIKGSKRTVMFPHDQGHEKIECVVCHHKVDNVQTFAKCADAGCHDNLVEKTGVQSLYYVMHSKAADLKHQTCMSCHVKIVEEKPDLKKELTGCSGSKCHPKVAKKTEEAEKESAS